MKDKRRTSTLETLADRNNIEVFQVPEDYQPEREGEPGSVVDSGWYWWSCCPGCLPDGEPSGPFDTYREALLDAVDGLED